MKNRIFLLICIAGIVSSFSLHSKAQNSAEIKTNEKVVFTSLRSAKELISARVKLIPLPQEVVWGKKRSSIESIRIDNPQLLNKNLTAFLIEISAENGIEVSPKGDVEISLNYNPDIEEEGYNLSIINKDIYLEFSTESGAFYGLQTLRQLIDNDNDTPSIQNCQIKDFPKFPVRGFMLDVGRNYQSMESLKKQLDIMARYKLNVFHWHLTDRPAWRIESHKYPELTAAENHRSSRDPGKFYTYDDIRELIAYAKQRSIQVIPEIDMPGHSDSFVTSMGVQMGSEKGMDILENILKEFFSEISAESCPIIHLGSDEVRIPNPDEFITRMVEICEDHDRQAMIWNPGLNANPNVIRQTWQDKHLEAKGYKEVDSWSSYVNGGEPLSLISKLFFRPKGYKSKNDVIGSILCLWPDVNLDNEEDAFRTNPHYPALLTHSWSCWTADIIEPHPEHLTLLPKKGSEAARYFSAFEWFLLDHKERYFANEPFAYYYQSNQDWKVAVGKDDSKDKDLEWIPARGKTIVFKDRYKQGGYFPESKTGETAFAETIILSRSKQTIKALIGFETPLRANRAYSGIPENGSWDANGGKIWVNGEELIGPEWENPGWKPSKMTGWGSKIDQEIPWTDEELYWTRKPALITLKRGKNVIRFKAPYRYESQNWMITFIPLERGIRK